MIISVNSFEEAKTYPVIFNTSEILMDATRDVFYVKTVNGTGQYTIGTFKFEKVENEQPLNAANFVTKEQFTGLSEKLDYLIKELGVKQDG